MADTEGTETLETEGTEHVETIDAKDREDGTKYVTYDRFSELVGIKNSAVSELADLRANVVELKAGHTTALDKLQTEVTTAQEKTTKLEEDKGWSDNLIDLAKDGIHDAEITEFLRYKHEHAEVAEGAEKPSFGDWFQEYKATEPAVLTPFLGGGGTGKAKPVKAVTGSTTPNNASGMDAKKIHAMSREEYQANREQLLKDV
jgi:hypothetical protein